MKTRTLAATILGVALAFSLWYTISQMAPVSGGGFAIVLSRNSTVLVADSDIQSYNASSHEFTLTLECADRLKSMGWRLSGDFKITVDGEPILTGVIVAPVVSRSYDANQVVLLYPGLEMDNRVMKLQMGYPQNSFLPWGSPYPLDNPLLVSYFGKVGRLTH